MLLETLRAPRWIIDGNYGRTAALRARYCDTLILLDVPTPICIISIVKRVLKDYGRTRPDMGGDCPDRFDLFFLRSALRHPKKTRARYDQMKEDPEFSHVRFIRLRGRRAAKRFLQNIPG